MTTMSQAPTLAATDAAPAVVREPARDKRPVALPAVVVAAALLLWFAGRSGYYTAGSDLGYYMGVAGGLMMLTLLLYPLRKHFRFLQPLGAIRHWFRLHMLFGILGPLLIVLHSTFRIGSLNAGVAMTCMLLVAGSGVIGRFIYTRIHHGLYGRKATLSELQTQFGMCEGEVQSKFHFALKVDQQLRAFGELAHTRPAGLLAGTWRLLTLGLRARHVHARCMRELRRVLGAHAVERGWERDKLRRRLDAASAMIRNYLQVASDTAHFDTYERLFSLWHILHVPFVFMLAISGVVHVIAVHMY